MPLSAWAPNSLNPIAAPGKIGPFALSGCGGVRQIDENPLRWLCRRGMLELDVWLTGRVAAPEDLRAVVQKMQETQVNRT